MTGGPSNLNPYTPYRRRSAVGFSQDSRLYHKCNLHQKEEKQYEKREGWVTEGV